MVSYLFLALLVVAFGGHPEKMLKSNSDTASAKLDLKARPARLLREVENVPETLKPASVDNSTFVVNEKESYGHYFPFAVGIDASAVSGPGRRSLSSDQCGVPSQWDHKAIFRLNTVTFNSQCVDKASYNNHGNWVSVLFEVEDDDRSCSGCVEQIHFGFWNKRTGEGRKMCINMGWRNFGKKTVADYFVLPSGEWTFFVAGSQQWYCRHSDWETKPSDYWYARSAVQDIVIR